MKYHTISNEYKMHMATMIRQVSLLTINLEFPNKKQLLQTVQKLKELIDNIDCCHEFSIRMNAGHECNHEFATDTILKIQQAECKSKIEKQMAEQESKKGNDD